ncbi:MAG: sulfotransferase [Acidobacteriaceae bacterium]|nr:sulfotransferase [Acidobacteriaceae bacterium]
MANPFLFLLGSPRSGTTLLKRIVDAHPLIAVVPEIRWLATVYARRENLTTDGLVTPAFLDQLHKFGRFAALPIARRELEPYYARPVPYAEFMTMLFDRYGEQYGCALVAHKNAVPGVSNDIGTLHALWPQAKIVHLIRDGRDVCLSVLDWRIRDRVARLFPCWAQSPVMNTALWWEWQIRAARISAVGLPNTIYRELRYEFLVHEPERACRELCDFIGVPYSDRMLRFYEERDPNKPAKQAWVPITPGRRDWRKTMTAEQLDAFEAVAGDLLEELGYERGAQSVTEATARLAEHLRANSPLRIANCVPVRAGGGGDRVIAV